VSLASENARDKRLGLLWNWRIQPSILAMMHHVKDLSSDQRLAIESLLGRTLRENESLTIRPAVLRKEAPQGEERARLARQYQKRLDALAERVKDVPEKEIDEAIDEAIRQTRQPGQ